jgi:cell division protein FtsB
VQKASQIAQVPGVLERLQQRARMRRRSLATVAAAALAGLMGYHVVFGHNGLVAYEHKRADKRDLTYEVNTLQQENQRLSDHVSRLQNDPDEIVHEAREQLHYTRPGEVIYSLPPDPAKPIIAAKK